LSSENFSISLRREKNDARKKKVGGNMKDWVLATAALVGGTFYLKAAQELPALTLGDAVGPRLFPTLVAFGLIASGVLIGIETTRARITQPVGSGRHKDRETVTRDWHHFLIIGCVLIWTIIYYSTLERVGYACSTTIYLLGLLAYFHRKTIVINLFIAAGFSAAAYVIFVFLLRVSLPVSPLSPWIGI
jgi:putative tricarboxylic transport membrane protein